MKIRGKACWLYSFDKDAPVWQRGSKRVGNSSFSFATQPKLSYHSLYKKDLQETRDIQFDRIYSGKEKEEEHSKKELLYYLQVENLNKAGCKNRPKDSCLYDCGLKTDTSELLLPYLLLLETSVSAGPACLRVSSLLCSNLPCSRLHFPAAQKG